ncbi:hypothetical protein NQ166_00125 [Microbacterium sp. zg.Y1090]|uniref:hypothetical protein n=1 Tax=Microbacterium wangruii TaxID=3049073 RepID=UPI00214CFD0F|nr:MULTISPECIES: hypothetical protein [unclassified Microbacterium]MCR2817235.1 hypothetical protein [Microbacterium sp. zg.Y1090]WIM29275.1 hypothetical protein QNO26_05085 [Microbacterium sp. zg-Y1090]
MPSNDRQRVERVPGARRAKLTPAPGTSPEPVPADADDPDAAPPAPGGAAAPGPNDERLKRDVPPHW